MSDEGDRNRQRNGRHREVRAKVEAPDRVPKYRLRMIAEENRLSDHLPRLDGLTRGECQGGHRPCPMVSCRHNLYLDVSPKSAAVKLNFPDLEPWEVDPAHSCSLDVADLGGATLEDVARAMNLTRERVRQIETSAIAHAGEAGESFAGLREHAGLGEGEVLPPVAQRVPPGEGRLYPSQALAQGKRAHPVRVDHGVHSEGFVLREDEPDVEAMPAPEPEQAEVPAWRKRMMELEAPREYPPGKSHTRVSLPPEPIVGAVQERGGPMVPATARDIRRVFEPRGLAVVHQAYVVPDPPKPTPEEVELSNALYPVIVECPWFEVVEERAERKRARSADRAKRSKAARARWRLVDGRATYCRRAG